MAIVDAATNSVNTDAQLSAIDLDAVNLELGTAAYLPFVEAATSCI